MDKSQIIAIGGLLVGGMGLAFSIYSRAQDRSEEWLDKQVKYKKEVSEKFEMYEKKIHELELKCQRLNSQKNESILLLEQKVDHIKNQYEHLHSQTKVDNDHIYTNSVNDNAFLESRIKSWADQRFICIP